jgi:hypothetical protein
MTGLLLDDSFIDALADDVFTTLAIPAGQRR